MSRAGRSYCGLLTIAEVPTPVSDGVDRWAWVWRRSTCKGDRTVDTAGGGSGEIGCGACGLNSDDRRGILAAIRVSEGQGDRICPGRVQDCAKCARFMVDGATDIPEIAAGGRAGRVLHRSGLQCKWCVDADGIGGNAEGRDELRDKDRLYDGIEATVIQDDQHDGVVSVSTIGMSGIYCGGGG